MEIVVRWEKWETNKVGQSWRPRNHSSGGETAMHRPSSKARRDAISHTQKWPLSQGELTSTLPEKIQQCSQIMQCRYPYSSIPIRKDSKIMLWPYFATIWKGRRKGKQWYLFLDFFSQRRVPQKAETCMPGEKLSRLLYLHPSWKNEGEGNSRASEWQENKNYDHSHREMVVGNPLGIEQLITKCHLLKNCEGMQYSLCVGEWVNESGQVGVYRHIGGSVVCVYKSACTPKYYACINDAYIHMWTENMSTTWSVHVRV